MNAKNNCGDSRSKTPEPTPKAPTDSGEDPNKPEAFKRAVYKDPRGDNWRLTIAEKKRILTSHIFGVDIDHQAVEVTKLSLLLKALEGESDATLSLQHRLFEKDRALPNLSDNIKCGNSLIGPGYFDGKLALDPDELSRVNPFDWGQGFPAAMNNGGFDCIIGNPPYGAFTGDAESIYLRSKYKSPANSLDTFLLFVERGHELLRGNGLLGMIIPSGWVSAPSAKPLRRLFIDSFKPLNFVSLPFDVFAAYIDTIIVIAQRVDDAEREARDDVKLVVFPHKFKITSQNDFRQFQKDAHFRDWLKGPHLEFLVTCSRSEAALLNKIRAVPRKLEDFVLVKRGIEVFSPQLTKSGLINPQRALETFQRFNLDHGKRGFVSYEPAIEKHKPFEYFSSPRILLRQVLSRQLRLQGVYATDSFLTNQSVQSLIPRTDDAWAPALQLLLGILNSRLMSWYFVNFNSVARRDDFPKIIIQQTRELPFPELGPHLAPSTQKRMTQLVDKMLECHQQLAAAASESRKGALARQIAATDAAIDLLVYELYGLTADEIAIVEKFR